MLDLLIKNGLVVDGTGAPGRFADVGLRGDTIEFIGSLPAESQHVIDAQGKVVCPGFIDLHTHSDGSFLLDPLADSKVRQGVTLELMGNCGMSFCAPLRGSAHEALDSWLAQYDHPFSPGWTDMDGYLSVLESSGSTLNLAAQVGHGTVRQCVMGMAARAPSRDELADMVHLVAQSLDQGALGLATGLFYAPGSYALTEEVIALAEVAASREALYSSHLRSEGADGPGLFTAYHEALEIARRSGVRVELSHVKCKGVPVWGRAEDILELISKARREGLDVAGDQYPYPRSSTALSAALFPKWALEGGRDAILKRVGSRAARGQVQRGIRDNIRLYGDASAFLIASFPRQREYEGKTLDVIADEMGCDPPETAIRLYESGEGSVVLASLSQADVDTIAAAPFISVASDGNSLRNAGPLSRGQPHPRSYGTHARFLQRYVLERAAVSLEEAIRRMTTLPADRLKLTHRGRLAPGYCADIVILDPESVHDLATFGEPHQYARGTQDVWVNGIRVVAGGEPTGTTPGRVLRAPTD